ncbi:glutathione S-transferase family protein [Paraburkholderia madseniana]|uniref:Glutathione S-transferase family protein n=1 Tax=Paraburkholderia madseniana TaxID=2599607 RepID=A0A6N6WF34_9BURK|nr:glutathione S-transferase family protein [Paraburkholderia madseniana]KAE8759106.1 glutathione S-transferase family protein [Paraburkholderia madseniana]NPT66885.1 glutathione S-transferase family protein [Paraburkholderia madseniana]
MKLYYAETLAPRKTCAVAKYLGLPIDYALVDLTKGEQSKPGYLAINPNGKVPCLVDGERIIWEADAIISHFAQRAESDLWPRDDRQIDVLRWFSWNSHHFYPHAGALYFESIIKPMFALGGPDSSKVAEEQGMFRKSARVLNQQLKGRKWLLGDGLSVADFSVAIALPYAKKAAMPLDEFPEIQRWHDQLNTIEAWRNPFPVRSETSGTSAANAALHA